MRITSSSSFLIATLASSSSLSALAAPTFSGPTDVVSSVTSGISGLTASSMFGGASEQPQRRGVLAAREPTETVSGIPIIGSIVHAVLSLLGLGGKAPVSAQSSPLTSDQMEQVTNAVKELVGSLPAPVPVPNAPVSNGGHAAYSIDDFFPLAVMNVASTPTSSTMTGYPTNSASNSQQDPNPSAPGAPGLPVAVPVNPLSPSLPANPPNTPNPNAAPGGQSYDAKDFNAPPSSFAGPYPTASMNGTTMPTASANGTASTGTPPSSTPTSN